jgi:glycosyltransferase involved in cell wall biosynthesis
MSGKFEGVSVSVIIPAYNSAPYLQECIESVLNQTFKNLEIIVVDDGSTDDTPDILNKYSDTITWIRQENAGPSAARNRGLEIAKGKYLCFLDADDRYKPIRLEKLVTFLEDHPDLGYAFSDLEQFENDQTVERSLIERWGKDFDRIPHKKIDEKSRIFTTTLTPFLISYRSFIHTSTITIRKTVLPEKPWFHVGFHYGEDAEFWARIAYHSRGGYIDEVLSEKRMVKTSLSHDKARSMENVGDLLGLREIQKTYYGSNREINAIIDRQTLDYAISYSWWLTENGHYKKARTRLLHYFKRYPFSIRLFKVMVKNLLQSGWTSYQIFACI